MFSSIIFNLIVIFLFYVDLQLLLDMGAKIDARTVDGWTPLHSAANWGNADVAAILLRYGADINSQTNGLQTPLHLAAANASNAEILKLLLTNEFLRPELRNKVGETAHEVAERCCRFHRLFLIVDPTLNSLTSS